jgi:xanthine dehydrogenase accessory factor
VKELTALGIEEISLNDINSPIGLYLGAETPEEIAVSIMAEIIMVRSQGSAGKARHCRDLEAGA